MNVRLRTLFAQAWSLPEDRQADLADLLESFMAEDGDDLFPAEELAELRHIEAEPDELADSAEVEAVLPRRGEAAVFTSEELARLDRLAAGPRVLADPEEVRAFFAGRG